MLKHLILTFALLCAVCGHENKKHRIDDPFTVLDHHITQTLAQHYLWPWNQLVRAAAALDVEESLEEPKIVSNKELYKILLNVKRFKPEELKVKVKRQYIIVEGKHKENNNDNRFMANHFVQRFVLPAGSKQDEVKAILKENGVLCVSVPKHELPPPLPERDVPIEVELPENKPEKPELSTDKVIETTSEKRIETSSEKVIGLPSEKVIEAVTVKKELESIPTFSVPPLEQLDLTEATTHVGKIRKKELKTTTKTVKDNEVTKGGSIDSNGLDYALFEELE